MLLNAGICGFGILRTPWRCGRRAIQAQSPPMALPSVRAIVAPAKGCFAVFRWFNKFYGSRAFARFELLGDAAVKVKIAPARKYKVRPIR